MDRADDPSIEETTRWLIMQPQGRAFLRYLAGATGFTSEVFNKQTSEMAFAAGKRAVFVELVPRLREADPVQFAKFIGDIL
ncbi:MAG: hypothetical protein Unbinned2819contig1000_10 [Prokaryotic dsDNA virus sp.]|nr:MAG: hypothetical protein Unbinned2819contig1000_10 [Prokaryotic dsDNA virus sp.]|tara:strand:- start:2421 stop:2663 length:243 start_codon:yes stop_codon:yes gene_type:complete